MEPDVLTGLQCALLICFVLDTHLLKPQVEDVNAKFDALEKLKNNNWKEEEKKTRKFTKKSKAKVLLVASYMQTFFSGFVCYSYLSVKRSNS